MVTPVKPDLIALAIESLKKIRQKPLLLLRMETVMPSVVSEVVNALKNKQVEVMDVILHTPGGHIESAFKIVKLIRGCAKKVNIIVPSYAKSAGTLICLAGESIILSTTSELGPLDVQIPEQQEGDVEEFKSALNGYKSLELIQKHAIQNMDVAIKLILRGTGNKMRLNDVIKLAIKFSESTSGCLYSQIHPKSIAEYARALDVGQQYGIRILTRYMGWQEKKAQIATSRLVYEYPSHSFIIDNEELMALGFPVTTADGELDKALNVLAAAMEERDHFEENEIKFFNIETPDKTKVQSIKEGKNESAKH